MKEKIKERMLKVNDISKMIFRYGSMLFIVLLLSALLLLFYFKDVYLNFIGRELLKSGLLVLLEVIIGAVAIDYAKSNN